MGGEPRRRGAWGLRGASGTSLVATVLRPAAAGLPPMARGLRPVAVHLSARLDRAPPRARFPSPKQGSGPFPQLHTAAARRRSKEATTDRALAPFRAAQR